MAKNKNKYSPGKVVDRNGNTWWMYDGQKYASYSAAQAAAAQAQLADQLLAGAGTMGAQGGPNWYRKAFGSGLTDAEIQQNQQNALEAEQARQFDAEQAELAWQRSEQSADNAMARQRELRQTAIPDALAGAEAAGVNAYFALGSSATGASSAPQGSAPSASSPAVGAGLPNAGGLADLMNLFRIKSEIAVNRSIAEKNRADAELAEKNAALTGKQVDWYDVVTSSTVSETRSQVVHNLETAASESERRQLMMSEKMLNNANATQIAALMPYYQRELDARATQEHASAAASLVHAAYEQGLIDNGMIQAAIRETNSRADVNEVQHSLMSLEDDIKHNRTTPLTEGNALTGLGNLLLGAFSQPLGLIHAGTSVSASSSVSQSDVWVHK